MRITVTGEAHAALAPELAVCHLSLGFESGSKEDAVRHATELAEAMSHEFQLMRDQDPSPVSETVLLPLSTRSWRPWASDGTQRPLRHRASSRAEVTFTNVQALSSFVDGWSRKDGVTVEHVAWELTRERRRRERAAILADAVGDARERAEILARAAGADGITFVELADDRYTDNDPRPEMFAATMARGSAPASDSGEGVDLTPADIDIRAQVQAIFTTN